MIAAFAEFITNAVVAQATNILAGYTTAAGLAQVVPVRRELSQDKAAVPEVTVETRLPERIAQEFIGGVAGYDATQHLVYATLSQGAQSVVTVRHLRPRERDHLHDYLAMGLLLGIDPATSLPWNQGLYQQSGLLVTALSEFTVLPPEPTTAYGDLHSRSFTLELTGELVATLATSPVTAVTILPAAHFNLPVNSFR